MPFHSASVLVTFLTPLEPLLLLCRSCPKDAETSGKLGSVANPARAMPVERKERLFTVKTSMTGDDYLVNEVRYHLASWMFSPGAGGSQVFERPFR